MPVHYDAQCPRCGRRFGWWGEVGQRPACPRCEHRPAQADLDRDAAHIADLRRLLLAHPAQGAEIRQRQRVAAGLTLEQAARFLGVSREELSHCENGRASPLPALANAMAQVYGVGDE